MIKYERFRKNETAYNRGINKPRCFKEVKKSLPLDYESNKMTWMTGDLFKN
jgi:hypothetical protein